MLGQNEFERGRVFVVMHVHVMVGSNAVDSCHESFTMELVDEGSVGPTFRCLRFSSSFVESWCFSAISSS